MLFIIYLAQFSIDFPSFFFFWMRIDILYLMLFSYLQCALLLLQYFRITYYLLYVDVFVHNCGKLHTSFVLKSELATSSMNYHQPPTFLPPTSLRNEHTSHFPLPTFHLFPLPTFHFPPPPNSQFPPPPTLYLLPLFSLF